MSELHVNYDFPGRFFDIQLNEIDLVEAGNCVPLSMWSVCIFAWQGNECKGLCKSALGIWELAGALF